MIKIFLERNLYLLIYLILSIGAVIPFFSDGFFQFHDDVQVARVYEMGKSLSSGQFPVRWVDDLGYGLGYPLFNFYSVLPYYLGGLFILLGSNALIATKIVFIAFIVGSGVAMYFFVKEFLGSKAAFIAAIVYLYFPYHAVNIYVRGDLAELSAYALMPLVFLSLFKIHLESTISRWSIVLGAITLAGVIISHNLSSFMLFIFAGIFIVFSVFSSKNRRPKILAYTLILTLAFFLSAFYALPASLEAKYSDVLSVIGGGSDFKDHFICITQLWDSSWGFGGSAPGCVDGISFRIGKVNILAAVLGIAFLFLGISYFKKSKKIVLSAVALLFISVFMTLEYSSVFWGLPFMDFLQFPWRFLNFIALFMSFVIASLIYIIREKFGLRWEICVLICLTVLTLFNNFKLFYPQKFLIRDSAYYTNTLYLNWTGSRISDEYLPRNFSSPRGINDASQIIEKYDDSKNPLYKKIRNKDGKIKFSYNQTIVQHASNTLTLIGFLLLALVIIGKPRRLFNRNE